MNTCIDAFKNLNIIGRNDGIYISPCCIAKPIVLVKQIDFKNDPSLSKIRRVWDDGRFPDECGSCKNAEESGQLSRRNASNQWYTDNKLDSNLVELIRLDYWVGDLCNLRCVICGPHFSSAWKKELQLPASIKTSSINYHWKTLDLSKIRYVHFNGGEPLLNKEHVEFLKSFTDKSKVHISYNTNGTVLPSQELLDLWTEFRIVQIDFSIDDIGDRFEYQRFPAEWDNVASNLMWFKDNCPVNCMFGINTTVSLLNYKNLHSLEAWITNNFNTNRVTDKVEFRKQPAIGPFAVSESAAQLTNARTLLDAIDARRGTRWQTVFPELV